MGVGPIREIRVIPPTWVVCGREWIIGWSRVIGIAWLTWSLAS